MTIAEISALQAGDIIMFPNGSEGTVSNVYLSNSALSLTMSGGSSMAGHDPSAIPPENQEQLTTVICEFADLTSAVKV